MLCRHLGATLRPPFTGPQGGGNASPDKGGGVCGQPARAAAVQAISVFVVITLLGATLGLLNMKLDKNRAARKKKKVRGHQ